MATRELYRLVPRLPDTERYGMRSQITRAVTSIPANIAEGWAPESPKEKAHFMAIAHASLAETETLLTLCEDQGWFPRNETQRLRELLDEVSRMLTAVRRAFRRRRKEERGESEEGALGASGSDRVRIGVCCLGVAEAWLWGEVPRLLIAIGWKSLRTVE